MRTNNDLIPINEELENFRLYLSKHKRCIFSARFGDGKSYFFTEFIKKYSNNYIFIPIYPVNYQVADNGNIFEYVKRDILIRLLMTKGVYIDNLEEKALTSLFAFLKKNKWDVFDFIMDIFPNLSLGNPSIELDVKDFKESCKSLNYKFKQYKKTEAQIAEDFINTLSEEKGSIYEFDAISKLIVEIIRKNSTNSDGEKIKEVVLIVEDLDRIDPAHIFRILNIFSAHFEWSNKNLKNELENKFELDKIISVCHYDNIKNIFSHFYGNNTDFEGYIHKFSTAEPYNYSLRTKLKKYIENNIDARLKKYPYLHKNLCEAIENKYIGSNTIAITSIRELQDRLKQAPYIKEYIQEIEDNKGEKYLINHHDSDLSIYLELTNRLNLDLHKPTLKAEQTKRTLDDLEYNKLMIKFIGKSYLLSFDTKNFIINNDEKSGVLEFGFIYDAVQGKHSILVFSLDGNNNIRTNDEVLLPKGSNIHYMYNRMIHILNEQIKNTINLYKEHILVFPPSL